MHGLMNSGVHCTAVRQFHLPELRHDVSWLHILVAYVHVTDQKDASSDAASVACHLPY